MLATTEVSNSLCNSKSALQRRRSTPVFLQCLEAIAYWQIASQRKCQTEWNLNYWFVMIRNGHAGRNNQIKHENKFNPCEIEMNIISTIQYSLK